MTLKDDPDFDEARILDVLPRRGRGWTAGGVARRFKITTATATSRLRHLRRHGFAKMVLGRWLRVESTDA